MTYTSAQAYKALNPHTEVRKLAQYKCTADESYCGKTQELDEAYHDDYGVWCCHCGNDVRTVSRNPSRPR